MSFCADVGVWTEVDVAQQIAGRGTDAELYGKGQPNCVIDITADAGQWGDSRRVCTELEVPGEGSPAKRRTQATRRPGCKQCRALTLAVGDDQHTCRVREVQGIV